MLKNGGNLSLSNGDNFETLKSKLGKNCGWQCFFLRSLQLWKKFIWKASECLRDPRQSKNTARHFTNCFTNWVDSDTKFLISRYLNCLCYNIWHEAYQCRFESLEEVDSNAIKAKSKLAFEDDCFLNQKGVFTYSKTSCSCWDQATW